MAPQTLALRVLPLSQLHHDAPCFYVEDIGQFFRTRLTVRAAAKNAQTSEVRWTVAWMPLCLKTKHSGQCALLH